MAENAYRFTVIMAVYNVEIYLREAVDSVICQDIGFEQVQMILVDDGSNDNSGRICDQYGASYPNIKVIHQNNFGVSAARNAGLHFAEGKYVSFLDADDRLSPNALSAVWDFFELHGEETDVVAIPIYFFEGKEGPHPLNYKFSQGSRIIDLYQEWDAIQLHISSSFIKRDKLTGQYFNTQLRFGEDSEMLFRLLLKKHRLGVVDQARYQYRHRTQGEKSAIQRSRTDRGRYLPKMEQMTEKTIAFCREQFCEVPKFIQYSLMYDLQWVLRMDAMPKGVLSEAEEKEYLDRMFAVISSFDDEIIRTQRNLDKEYIYWLLQKKHDRDPEIQINKTTNDLELCYGGSCAGRLSDTKLVIDFVHLEGSSCIIEGNYQTYPVDNLTVSLFAQRDNKTVYSEVVPEVRTRKAFGESLYVLHGYKLTIPLEEKHCRIVFFVNAEGITIKPKCEYGWYSPISDDFKQGYYEKNGWCLRIENGDILADPITCIEKTGREIRYLSELLFDRHRHRRKAALIRMLYWLSLAGKKQPIWMVSDRRVAAGDNGEAFFRYLRKAHPEIDARFILKKNSRSFESLKKIGTVIENETIAEKLTALMSDYIVSSQGEWQYINPLYKDRIVFRDIMGNKPFVFLQHGIIKDDLSEWLMRPNKHFFGFVTSAVPEYESILYGAYGYSDQEVWLTGLPRYDRLKAGVNPKRITIMPTWRSYLMLDLQRENMIHPLAPDFQESDFFRFYHALLSDQKLRAAAQKNGYKISFLPHPHFQPYVSTFADCEEVEFLGTGTDYREIYETSALVVTDYSSAVFDAVYLYKPVIYAQFDREQFFSGEHNYRKGYFDYEGDGFGEVEYDLEGTIQRIVEYMENGCRMKQKYRERADQFYAFRDQNNCQRVYDKIMEGRP